MKTDDVLTTARHMVSSFGDLTNEFVRAVAVGWDAKSKRLVLRYYFSRTPTDEDDDMCASALTELCSSYWQDIESAAHECVQSEEPLEALDKLDGFAFSR